MSRFESEFLGDIADLLRSEDPSSEGLPHRPEDNVIDLVPFAMLQPAENPYFALTENYVAIDHIRLATELCSLISVPPIHGPEEAAAECAPLEKIGAVDAVASEDNNAVLFGVKWLIRRIFGKPQSIIVRFLERIGVAVDRLLMLAMMIDGDYNSAIRRRLFTVGPVRGMELIAQFPDPEMGLFEFNAWWIRVVKCRKEEGELAKRLLAKKNG
jgi:5'-3' exonuclease